MRKFFDISITVMFVAGSILLVEAMIGAACATIDTVLDHKPAPSLDDWKIIATGVVAGAIWIHITIAARRYFTILDRTNEPCKE